VNAYLDTSGLLKLYLPDEGGGDDVRHWLAEAELTTTSAVAYPEARAALARRRRERTLTSELFRTIRRELDHDWPYYFAIEPTLALWHHAGDLAEGHHLRALDAIHLASFVELFRRSDGNAEFLSFDARLNRAARAAVKALRQ
jgi:predicted nucleic acid-binding protein